MLDEQTSGRKSAIVGYYTITMTPLDFSSLPEKLKKLLQASDSLAFPVVIVDKKDGVADFYKQYGFTAFQGAENKLFITLAALRASLA